MNYEFPYRQPMTYPFLPIRKAPMETSTFTQDILLPAAPEAVYHTLVEPAQHAAFTGQPALHTNRLDLDFQTYGGFASGRNLELLPGRLIRQVWRAQMEPWPATHFSTVSYELRPHAEGTLLRLTHADVPAHLAAAMADGWHQWYWTPLVQYLAAAATVAA